MKKNKEVTKEVWDFGKEPIDEFLKRVQKEALSQLLQDLDRLETVKQIAAVWDEETQISSDLVTVRLSDVQNLIKERRKQSE